MMEQSHFGMTGQNKVWLAGNVLIRGLLLNDSQLVKEARENIGSEIVLGQKRVFSRTGASISMVPNNSSAITDFLSSAT